MLYLLVCSLARPSRALQVGLVLIAQRGLFFRIFGCGIRNIHSMSCFFERDTCKGCAEQLQALVRSQTALGRHGGGEEVDEVR